MKLASVTLPARAAFEQPGAADQRVGTEVQRVQELVVDAPVDDVDALLAGRRAHVDDVLPAYEVATLDELDTHLTREERVLEVRGVVYARREHDDLRIAAPGGAVARNAPSKRVG